MRLPEGSKSEHRRVLVTGGATGIGAAIVQRAHQESARVGVLDIAPCSEADVSTQVDIGDPNQVADAVKELASELGGVDLLVNNAGVAPAGRMEDMPFERWRHTVQVNLDGLFLTTSAALPWLRASGSSSAVVNLGSIAGRSHSRTASVAYASTKGAAIAFTRQLARELADEAIRVNCVCPGLVDTEIMARNVDPNRLAELVSGIPLGRLASPGEIADVVWFLGSPEASYLTGSVVDVTGGLT